MADQDRGVLTAVVLKVGDAHVYVRHDGAPAELELAENIAPGGDWDEALVYHEDAPPYPPADGLWQLVLPWRRLTSEERESESELCCKYTTKPQWVRIDEPMQDALRFHALVRTMQIGVDEAGKLFVSVTLDDDFVTVAEQANAADIGRLYPWLTAAKARSLLGFPLRDEPFDLTDGARAALGFEVDHAQPSQDTLIRAIDFHLRDIVHG